METEEIDVQACPRCGFAGGPRTRRAPQARGYVEVCVNCLHPRLLDGPNAAAWVPPEAPMDALWVELRGQTWRSDPCPRCTKSHGIISGFADPRAMIGYRVEAPCGGEPLLLLERPAMDEA